MALNSLFCADVPLSNYSLTPDKWPWNKCLVVWTASNCSRVDNCRYLSLTYLVMSSRHGVNSFPSIFQSHGLVDIILSVKYFIILGSVREFLSVTMKHSALSTSQRLGKVYTHFQINVILSETFGSDFFVGAQANGCSVSYCSPYE